jgi:hypothetical protein
MTIGAGDVVGLTVLVKISGRQPLNSPTKNTKRTIFLIIGNLFILQRVLSSKERVWLQMEVISL